MDLGSLIVMLILLAIFAGAMYIGYQKFVVEGGASESQVPVEPSAPTEPLSTPSSSDVPGVDSVKGRPLRTAMADSAGNWYPIRYYGEGGDIIAPGYAKTASACYEASKARGINNWAWDRKDKRCFAYTDSTLFTVMTKEKLIDEKNRYVVGCTEPGVTVGQGCTDFTTGNKVKGWKNGHGHTLLGSGGALMSLEDCQKDLRNQGYDMGFYVSDRHWGPACYYYPNAEDLRGWTGNNVDLDHITMCSDPTKKVIDACQ